jgi:hypothetical protein
MQRTFARYRTTADPAMIPATRPANHVGNTIIVRLIWIGLAALTAWLVYRHWTGSETPTVPPEATAAVSSTSVPEVALTPIASVEKALHPCIAVSNECGDVTPAGVKVAEGTAGYHKDADGRVRPDAPPGWIAMPDCKGRGLRVWVETNSQGDVLSYHCKK